MNWWRLLARTLRFHAVANVAAALGIAVATAALVGALLVGDSLRGSLAERIERQRAGVAVLVTAPRFFRTAVASELGKDAVPAIVVNGTLLGGDAEQPVRIAGATVYGLPFNQLDIIAPASNRTDPTTMLSDAVARRLPPGTLRAQVGQISELPRESLLGQRDAASVVSTVDLPTVAASAPPGFSNFSLQPTTDAPRNAFVPLDVLQQALDQRGRANAVLLPAGNSSDDVKAALQQSLTLDDWGLTVRTPERRTVDLFAKLDRNKDGVLERRELRGLVAEAWVQAADRNSDKELSREDVLAAYRARNSFALTSRRMMLEPAIERAALAAAQTCGLRTTSSLVYLANNIRVGEANVPYSLVAALDASEPAPFGPWLPAGEPPLADDEIILVDWPGSPWSAAKPGDRVTLDYFLPEQEGRVVETSHEFRVRALVPMTGPAFDPDLAPEFPGITDRLSLGEWNPPFPYDNKRVHKRDEEFWQRYRASPKAVVNRAIGAKLFGSRFGQTTSIRFAPLPGRDIEDAAHEFERTLQAALKPADGGFVVESLLSRSGQAGTDFGGLFLGFSFYLIASAVLLAGLLMRLAIERRASDLGLLLAIGFAQRRVRRLLLEEGLALALAGIAIGLPLALAYAALMLKLLALLWPGGEAAAILHLHAALMSFVIGAVAMIVVAFVVIVVSLRGMVEVSPARLLKGDLEGLHATKPVGWPWLSWSMLMSGPVLLLATLAVSDPEAKAGLFFGGGGLLLAGMLGLFRHVLRIGQLGPLTPGRSVPMLRLAQRNLARFPSRSVLTVTLLSLAAFLLVAVEAFRKQPDAAFLSKDGGSGGFALFAESDLPLYRDPSSEEGKAELLELLEKTYQRDPATKAAKLDAARTLLANAEVVPLRLKAGDDASCLNLLKPGQPRIVGVPERLRARGGFTKGGLTPLATEATTTPAFGEANSVQWMLKPDPNGMLEVLDDRGEKANLHIAGLLHDSVFQSELLIAEERFTRLYPSADGYRILLIAPPPGREAEVATLFETAYAARGLTVTPAAERVARYQAVENMYLSTFQILGGFGLLLGAAGLAVVLLRNVWDRRAELALMRAVGFHARQVGRMIFAENAALLVVGLGIGVVAALAAAIPHWREAGGSVQAGRLLGMLALVAMAGAISGGLAVRATVRAPIIPSLRRE